MKKIVPFKKDIEFNTNIAEISSISLEHTLKLKEENLVSGEFIVSGTYKLTESSINTTPFEYKLPFDISIDKKYDTKELDVDINDFYYEVTNNEILSINIEVVLDGLKEKEEREDNIMTEEKTETLEEVREEIEVTENKNIDNFENVEENKEETETSVKSIFEDLDENERYSVYKVHIVTENDTIEEVTEKYETTREELESYNDLNDLKIGDKLIIPSHEN